MGARTPRFWRKNDPTALADAPKEINTAEKPPPQKPTKTQKVRSVAIHPCAIAPCQFPTTWKCSPVPAAKRKATKTKLVPPEMPRQAKRHSYLSVPVKYGHRGIRSEPPAGTLHSPIQALEAITRQMILPT